MDSKWKIGGFELAAKGKSCTKQVCTVSGFMPSFVVVSTRASEIHQLFVFFLCSFFPWCPSCATEMQSRQKTMKKNWKKRGGGPCPSSNLAPPIHSRDCWAFGNLMLQTIEEVDNDGMHIDGRLYIFFHMLILYIKNVHV